MIYLIYLHYTRSIIYIHLCYDDNNNDTFIFTVQADFKCPQKHGVYEDPKQCDKFYECDEGQAVEKLCPDGLVFDPLNRKINKCDQPFNVDCGDRLELRKLSSIAINRFGDFR